MEKPWGSGSISVIAILVAMSSPPAAAQTSTGADKRSREVTVQEVTVTARKREERLQDVPEAITAISGATIDQQQMRDVRDFATLTPNLVINPVAAQANAAAIYIRGFGQQDIDRTYAPAVSVILDGVVQGNSTAEQLLNVFNLSDVEVLRGPQGTLFGPNSIGGVIILNRPKPSGVFGGDVSATFGNYGQKDWKGSLDFPITQDLAGRIAVGRLEDDGPYYNLFDGRRRGFKNYFAVSTSVLYKKDRLSIQGTFDWSRDKSDWGVLQNLSNQFDLWCGTLGYCYNPNQNLLVVDQHGPNYLHNDTYAGTFTVNYALAPNATLTSISGYRRIYERKGTDFDALPVNLFSSVQPVDEEQVTQEVRLNIRPLPRLNVTSGLYYNYDDYSDGVNTLYIFSLFGLPPGATEVVNKHQRTNTYGVFSQADYQITRRLSVTAGLRFTAEEKQFIYRDGFGAAGDFYPQFNDFSIIASGKHTWTQLTPRLGLNYKINPDILVYASWAEGFKSGGFNGRGNSQDTIGPYNPENVDTFEVGFKGDFLDHRIQTNIAAFYNDYRNKQESVVERNELTGATITPTVNAGSATIQGVEFETLLVPARGVRIRADADYLDAHYDHFVYDGVDVARMVKLLVTPRWKYSITPEYIFQAAGGTVDASLTYSYTSSFETELGPRYDGGPGPLWNDPRGHIAPPGNLDVSLSYAFDYQSRRYKIAGFGRNVTNNVYIASAAPGANLFNFGTPSRPRTYGVELSAKF